MPPATSLAADLVAIVVLAVGVYFRRHRRGDLVVAFVGVNVGVMAVATALGEASAAAGLGFGLFGVLSIVRLRSAELSHAEVTYYFLALALGLLAGLRFEPAWAAPTLMVLLVAVAAVFDHPRTFAGYRHQMVTLDAAYTDEAALVNRLEEVLGGAVKNHIVLALDLVRDTTTVDVRYKVSSGGGDAGEAATPPVVRAP